MFFYLQPLSLFIIEISSDHGKSKNLLVIISDLEFDPPKCSVNCSNILTIKISNCTCIKN